MGATLIARVAYLSWFVDHAHFLAAAGLFLCLLVVAMLNAHRVKEGQPAETRVQQSRESVVELVSVQRDQNRYVWIARALLVVAAGSAVLMFLDAITLFWFEIAVAGVFVAFWIAQTLEFEKT